MLRPAVNFEEEVLPVVTDEWVSTHLKEDEVELSTLTVREDVREYLIYREEGVVQGVIRFEYMTQTSVLFHPYMYKWARHNSRKMIEELFDICLHNSIKQVKLQVLFPACRKKLFNFAIKMGFKLEGTMRQAQYIDGKCVDMLLMGITRDEMAEYKNGRRS